MNAQCSSYIFRHRLHVLNENTARKLFIVSEHGIQKKNTKTARFGRDGLNRMEIERFSIVTFFEQIELGWCIFSLLVQIEVFHN